MAGLAALSLVTAGCAAGSRGLASPPASVSGGAAAGPTSGPTGSPDRAGTGWRSFRGRAAGRPVISTAPSPIAGSSVAVLADDGRVTVVRSELSDPALAAERVARETGRQVLAASRPQPMRSFTTATQDTHRSALWSFDQLHVEDVWATYGRGAEQVVAVVDTGVLSSHADLSGQVLTGTDLVNSSGGNGWTDTVGHGTHISGTIAAIAGNSQGVAGLAPQARILPVRVLDDSGGRSDVVASGVRWAADHGASVINLSLGSTGDDPVLHAVVDSVVESGVVVVAAAGNSAEDGNPTMYPAAYDSVIAVGALAHPAWQAVPGTLTRASFSETGSWVDVLAPGQAVLSTYPASGYRYADGTSMAAPHVAATVALLRSWRPSLTPAQIADVLESTATDVGTPGRDDGSGYGLINPAAALAAAGGSTSTSTSTSTTTSTSTSTSTTTTTSTTTDSPTPTPSPTGIEDPTRVLTTVSAASRPVHGVPVRVSARLTTLSGIPISGRTVAFNVQPDGSRYYRATTAATDAGGWARTSLTLTAAGIVWAVLPPDTDRGEAQTDGPPVRMTVGGSLSLAAKRTTATRLTVSGTAHPATALVTIQRLSGSRWVKVCSIRSAAVDGRFSAGCTWPRGLRATVRAVTATTAGVPGTVSSKVAVR